MQKSIIHIFEFLATLWPSFINAVQTKFLAYTKIPAKVAIYDLVLTLTLNLGRIKSHVDS